MEVRKTLITLSLMIFLLVGATGMAYSGTMMDHGMETMLGCPLMSHSAAICNMSPLEHLTQWQNMFAAIPAQSVALLLLMLLALFFFLRLDQYRWLLHPSPHPVYVSYDPEAVTHDSLRRFIARGLLHPKIF